MDLSNKWWARRPIGAPDLIRDRPTALPEVKRARLLREAVGNLSPAVEVARWRPAILADATLPGEPLRTVGAGSPAGYGRPRIANRQALPASRRRWAARRRFTLDRGRRRKRVQCGPETRGEIRATSRRRRNGRYDRCGGKERHHRQAHDPHRFLRSRSMYEIIAHDPAGNDNGAMRESAFRRVG
jgi:hypothetical protein